MPASPLNVVERLADGLAVVRLNRPDRLNALSQEAVAALTAMPDNLAKNEMLHVVNLTGEGALSTPTFAEKRAPRFTGH